MRMPRIKQIKTFDTFLKQSRARVNVVYGGAGSGKSFSVAQHLLSKFLLEKNKRILITRKTLPSLKITAWYEVVRMLRDWGIPVEINKAELTIKFGDNEILAKSLDDPEKIKSAEFNYIWIEEATELSKEDFIQLNLRLRRVTTPDIINQMFLTFNPIDQYHWCITNLVQGNNPETAIHHSTYKNNPFLSVEYIRELENLINQDENYYRIYTLGEPGVLRNIIYTNYFVDREWRRGADTFYGLDFGFNNATALLRISLHDNEPYLQEIIYQSGLTNQQVIEKLGASGIQSSDPIYYDAAEPQRGEEIRKAGFNAKPAEKNIKDGIDFVKRHRLHIHPDSINLLGEIRGYKYKEDKNGRVYEDPVKFRDHCFVAGTMITTLDGDKPIERVTYDDMVLTRKGFRCVTATWKNGFKETYDVELSDGTHLIGTGNHPVYVEGKSFIPIDTIEYDDTLCQLKKTNGHTTEQRDLSGLKQTEQYPPDITSITKTKTRTTTSYQTLSVNALKSIYPNILPHITVTIKNWYQNILQRSDLLPKSGTHQMSVESGIDNTVLKHTNHENRYRRYASNAARCMMTLPDATTHDSVQTPANRHGDALTGLTTPPSCANGANDIFKPVDTDLTDFALVPVRVKRVRKHSIQWVYNLSVDEQPEYFANGILVHNCMDALRYGLYTHRRNMRNTKNEPSSEEAIGHGTGSDTFGMGADDSFFGGDEGLGELW